MAAERPRRLGTVPEGREVLGRQRPARGVVAVRVPPAPPGRVAALEDVAALARAGRGSRRRRGLAAAGQTRGPARTRAGGGGRDDRGARLAAALPPDRGDP